MNTIHRFVLINLCDELNYFYFLYKHLTFYDSVDPQYSICLQGFLDEQVLLFNCEPRKKRVDLNERGKKISHVKKLF